jgi:uncharacterized protein
LRYKFGWNPDKARENLRKHRISFDRAATTFLDPNALSIFDIDHSQEEDRWVTLGLESNGTLLVVIHTFESVNPSQTDIRIISARKATVQEIRQYQEENV